MSISIDEQKRTTLEWSDRDQAETVYSPLILCESKIEKRRTRNGAEFWLSRIGDEPTINTVLAEKLKLEFGVELPAFIGPSIEEYFADVAKHVGLVYCLDALKRKEAAFFALDSHAGRGLYDLQCAEAQKSGEASPACNA